MAFHHLGNTAYKHTAHSTTMIQSIKRNIQAIAYSTYCHVTTHEYSLNNWNNNIIVWCHTSVEQYYI